jgi:hypothetical protein
MSLTTKHLTTAAGNHGYSRAAFYFSMSDAFGQAGMTGHQTGTRLSFQPWARLSSPHRYAINVGARPSSETP